MTDDRLGTILRDGDRVGLFFRRRLRHSPERVWTALTESDDLSKWWPCDIVGDRRAGAPLQMPFWPIVVEKYGPFEDVSLPGEMLTWDPPKVLEYRWDTEVLRWELTPVDDGTELTITTWLTGRPQDPPAESAAAGYTSCLDSLVQLLDGDPVTDPTEAEMEALQAHYRAEILAGA